MYTQVATKLAITGNEYSQAVSMDDGNAAITDFTVFSLTATSVTVQIQGSNDLENWVDVGTATPQTAPGAYSEEAIGVAWAYVRLKYLVGGAGTVILAAGINTAAL